METTWDPAASGFTYDATAGYYVSSDSGLYFDYKTKGFFNTGDGKWCVLLLKYVLVSMCAASCMD